MNLRVLFHVHAIRQIAPFSPETFVVKKHVTQNVNPNIQI